MDLVSQSSWSQSNVHSNIPLRTVHKVFGVVPPYFVSHLAAYNQVILPIHMHYTKKSQVEIVINRFKK